ncbi:MAG TPA: hypothetical protein VMF89_36735 [Polyangiales bacterium]|nr:hypothetical protein [Polyangiales bacterium]
MTGPEEREEPPPILGSWRALYWLLIVELVLLTLAGYLLGRWAA